MKIIRLCCIILMLLSVASSQENQIKENTNVWNGLRHAWKSWWISHPTESLLDYGIFHYRRTFELDNVPASFTVNVSADSRYRLYVNGKYDCEGPVKNDFLHWNYESVDFVPYLNKGVNVIASKVYNPCTYRQPSQSSRYTAFILQGDTPEKYIVNTIETWKAIGNMAYNPVLITEQMAHGFYVTGPCNSVIADQYPWGWEQPGFDDSAWPNTKGFMQDRGTEVDI